MMPLGEGCLARCAALKTLGKVRLRATSNAARLTFIKAMRTQIVSTLRTSWLDASKTRKCRHRNGLACASFAAT
jgi:hypothetical protein